MNRLIGSLGLAAALILAACNSSPQPPNMADWCYQFDFTNNDSMDLTYGRWLPGVGYSTDENNNLGLTYQHSVTVAPILARVGIQKGSYGDISVASSGTVFGINMENQATIPAAAPANTVYPVDFSGTTAGNLETIGSQINTTVQANGNILVAYLEVYGVGANPFGSSNCPAFIEMTYAPPPTSTGLPTSQPTWTPEVTDLPTLSPTPTITVTPSPSHSPTPTPTPTAYIFLGPVSTVQGNVNCPYECYLMAGAPADERAYPVGVMLLEMGGDISGNVAYGPPVSMKNGSINDLDFLTATPGHGLFDQWTIPNITPAPAGLIVAGVNPTAVTTPGQQLYTWGNRYNALSTWYKWAFSFWGDGSGGFDASSVYARFRPIMYGYPTPTPTPTNTPTWSPTPTRTPQATNLFTQTPAGPTFTPNPRATSITAIPYLPGNTYRGPEGVCKFGAGNYLWDFRLQSAYAQGWTNPYPDEESATFQQYIGMSAPLVNGTRLARFVLNLPPGATVSNVQVYSPSGNTSWNVAGGFAASRNPNWQAAMSGSGWNSSGTLNGTSPTQIYAAVRTNNADPLHVMFIAVNVSNCQATPTATVPFQVQPPVNTIAPLPTIYNWLTPSGTYQVFGTPYGTPGQYGTPAGTPDGTPGTGTPTPGDIPGEYGDIADLGGNILGVGGNLFGLGRNWLGDLSARVSGIVGAWNTAPVTAPPGVPLCTTQPQLNEFCAILYFLRFTIFSGPIGSLIMPLATIVFDLFIVFLFIRMLRAILARLSKVTEV